MNPEKDTTLKAAEHNEIQKAVYFNSARIQKQQERELLGQIKTVNIKYSITHKFEKND